MYIYDRHHHHRYKIMAWRLSGWVYLWSQSRGKYRCNQYWQVNKRNSHQLNKFGEYLANSHPQKPPSVHRPPKTNIWRALIQQRAHRTHIQYNKYHMGVCVCHMRKSPTGISRFTVAVCLCGNAAMGSIFRVHTQLYPAPYFVWVQYLSGRRE